MTSTTSIQTIGPAELRIQWLEDLEPYEMGDAEDAAGPVGMANRSTLSMRSLTPRWIA
jgi:hypothetical protein